MNLTFTRRMFAVRLASVLSALGVTAAVLPNRALAQSTAAPGLAMNSFMLQAG